MVEYLANAKKVTTVEVESPLRRILIIGGVAGGASAATKARRLDEHAQITMIEKRPYVSFANCGLPYYVSGEIKTVNELLLETPDSFYHRFGVEVRSDLGRCRKESGREYLPYHRRISSS